MFCPKPHSNAWLLKGLLVVFLSISSNQNIMKICPCNVHPLTSHFYMVKLRFTRVYIFLIFAPKHISWVLVRTASELPQWGSSNTYPRSMFWAKIRKNSLIAWTCLLNEKEWILSDCLSKGMYFHKFYKAYISKILISNEPRPEKTNNLDSDRVWH